MSRLTIDITDQQHQSLTAMAAQQGKTVRQYALDRLFPDRTDSDDAWDELKALLEERIAEGLAGNVSTMTAEEIFEEELRKKRGL